MIHGKGFRSKAHQMLDVILTRPFDVLVALACILTGLRILVDGGAAPNSIEAMPEFITYPYRILLIVAGSFYMLGLMKRGPSVFERVGLWLAATAFVVYGVAATSSGISSQATFAVSLVFCIGFACILRALGIGRESKARLAAMREVRRGQG